MSKIIFITESLLRFVLLFLMIITVMATSCRQKQVWLSQYQRSNLAENENVVRVYMDRFGDFYPNTSVYIDYRDFASGDGVNNARLEHIFTTNPSYNKVLATTYNLPSTDPDQTYEMAQQKILHGYKMQLDSFVIANKLQSLVVFVHGFNDPNPAGDFQELRAAIKSRGYRNLAYLEIYWDGLTANGASAGLSGIWGMAQQNSRYVAIGLRTLLNKLETKLPVVIISHSLGASVATGSLFNTTSKWTDSNDIEIAELLKQPAPEMPIRLGMLAPAIPGKTTFIDFKNRSRPLDVATDNIQCVVIGYNSKDYALNKGFFNKSQRLSKTAGATTLGANYKGEAYQITPILDKHLGYGSRADKIIVPLEFKTKTFDKNGDSEHGLHFYIQDTTAINQFFKILFEK